MKKTALIILAEGFEEIEAITPIDILRRSEVNVIIAGLFSLEVKGARGMTIKADCLIDNIPEDFHAIILPGGGAGAKNLAESQKVTNLIKKQHEKGGIIAAICASPAVVLYPIGILTGKKVTSYPTHERDFTDDVTYINDCVVVDGNIVMSRGPGTAFEFSLVLAKMLAGEKIAQEVGKATLYYQDNMYER